ncbi:choline/ethanolamine kinase-like [Octopus sinensis]|uniref:Choline/ethanolamine kinase-like n=1 Tax=Octopus sinensis TaxID=2607531 RepID=A0A6P7TYD9_9MOLL|nr:choline/ethanolamine kinase-like [Octopus sinensis]
MSKPHTLTDEEIVPTIAKYNNTFELVPTNQKELTVQYQHYILEKCIEYIGNQWKGLSVPQVTIKRITSGTSNIIFTVTLNSQPNDNSPKTVLVRIYGRFLSASFRNQLKDAVVFAILSERSLGPKLYGIFECGRSQGLSPLDIRSSRIYPLVASRMAQIHNLNVPISKSPRFLFETMRAWLEEAEKVAKDFEGIGDQLILADNQSPVCFCHNDLQAGNILLRSSEASLSPDDLLVIDYEYCSYNYRDYDLANFFCELSFEYSNDYEDGFFYFPDRVPTLREKVVFVLTVQEDFIRAYIDNWNFFSDNLISMEDIKSAMKSVEVFELASHIFWTLWSIRQSQSSSIGFGYAVLFSG